MSRYNGPIFKKSRHLGFSILETGKELAKKPFKPGEHGNPRDKKNQTSRRSRPTTYGTQLLEKQKLRYLYGLNEKQFRNLFNKAGKLKGVHGEMLFRLLESRLDNIVYRLGLANTRREARQIVNHGHICVNGKKVDIPSFEVKPGMIISVKDNKIEHKKIRTNLENKKNLVDYVEFDNTKLSGTYLRYPERSELNNEINESLIVEYYNR